MAMRDSKGRFIKAPIQGNELVAFRVLLWGTPIDTVHRKATQPIEQIKDNLVKFKGLSPKIVVQRA